MYEQTHMHFEANENKWCRKRVYSCSYMRFQVCGCGVRANSVSRGGTGLKSLERPLVTVWIVQNRSGTVLDLNGTVAEQNWKYGSGSARHRLDSPVFGSGTEPVATLLERQGRDRDHEGLFLKCKGHEKDQHLYEQQLAFFKERVRLPLWKGKQREWIELTVDLFFLWLFLVGEVSFSFVSF